MQADIHNDHIDRDVVEVTLTGQMLPEHPLLNKGTSFPEDERLYWLLRVSVPKMIGADCLRYPLAH
jgi:hypothetical protein